jgi:hypothetical protein
MVLESEFASVEVSLDHTANGPRLRIHDLRGGGTTHLDPLVLETLVYLRADELAGFLDPGATRWAGPFDE